MRRNTWFFIILVIMIFLSVFCILYYGDCDNTIYGEYCEVLGKEKGMTLTTCYCYEVIDEEIIKYSLIKINGEYFLERE